MPPTQPAERRQSGIRKRASNACHRCRQQKIRCSGQYPCEQCTKRDLRCNFEDRSDKVLVPRSFLDDLERRAGHESRPSSAAGPSETQISHSNRLGINVARPLESRTSNTLPRDDGVEAQPAGSSSILRPGSETRSATPTAQLTNPFSTHAPRYLADRTGRPWYLGTSSNWAFNRQVLGVIYERLTGHHALTDSAYSTLYDLGWDGQRNHNKASEFSMPSSDYAIYLINAVKFHCGQVFHLFDETTFMQHFAGFQAGETGTDSLWYIHFLVILAFGKVFVTRRNESRKPPGADLLVQAMKSMPDMIFLYAQPADSLLQAMEIYCSMALYLQCLDFRGPAYDMIGRALRLALEEGMHTCMDDHGLDVAHVQRCRNVWWTIYILDRQFCSWMGSPLTISDEDISACLPSSSGTLQRGLALELNVKLSRTLAQILNTIYGTEGRLSRKFMSSTKNALKSIADVTSALKRSFDLPTNGRHGGISRLAAHLHLLHDQCIVLAIRPLLFSLLKMSMDHPRKVQSIAANSNSARTLLQICLESSQHIIMVLDKLREQDLLETFLPFDLEAVNAASTVVLLTPIVDNSLLHTSFPWVNMIHNILDEMIHQGNLQAVQRKAELNQLQQAFMEMPYNQEDTLGSDARMSQNGLRTDSSGQAIDNTTPPHDAAVAASHARFDIDFEDEIFWRDAFTADQLLDVADNLDLDGVDWMTTGSSNC